MLYPDNNPQKAYQTGLAPQRGRGVELRSGRGSPQPSPSPGCCLGVSAFDPNQFHGASHNSADKQDIMSCSTRDQVPALVDLQGAAAATGRTAVARRFCRRDEQHTRACGCVGGRPRRCSRRSAAAAVRSQVGCLPGCQKAGSGCVGVAIGTAVYHEICLITTETRSPRNEWQIRGTGTRPSRPSVTCCVNGAGGRSLRRGRRTLSPAPISPGRRQRPSCCSGWQTQRSSSRHTPRGQLHHVATVQHPSMSSRWQDGRMMRTRQRSGRRSGRRRCGGTPTSSSRATGYVSQQRSGRPSQRRCRR